MIGILLHIVTERYICDEKIKKTMILIEGNLHIHRCSYTWLLYSIRIINSKKCYKKKKYINILKRFTF